MDSYETEDKEIEEIEIETGIIKKNNFLVTKLLTIKKRKFYKHLCFWA